MEPPRYIFHNTKQFNNRPISRPNSPDFYFLRSGGASVLNQAVKLKAPLPHSLRKRNLHPTPSADNRPYISAHMPIHNVRTVQKLSPPLSHKRGRGDTGSINKATPRNKKRHKNWVLILGV